eukprot:7386549-Prymnesium_polylepis.2
MHTASSASPAPCPPTSYPCLPCPDRALQSGRSECRPLSSAVDRWHWPNSTSRSGVKPAAEVARISSS